MRRAVKILIRGAALALLLGAALPHGAGAVGTGPAVEPPVDSAPCFAAINANEADAIIAGCAALIDHEKTAKADRLKALIARAGAYDRKGSIARAIGDYDMALRLDPAFADGFNARGELWYRKGDRRRALADFDAAIRLNPDHATARANYRSLVQELERIGALLALDGKPSFNCATARRAVEKAICARPELANLDREISTMSAKLIRKAREQDKRAAVTLQREQDEFIAHRNASFGQLGYDLNMVMKERLDHLKALERR
jgi:tetratricopeptide (TPR) repeat protein